jgi:hypothetical protein
MRPAVAAVWWYQGVYQKILGHGRDQRAIVAGVPGLPAGWVTGALVGLGLVEAGLGAWVLSGWRSRTAAAAQTALIAGVTAGGLAAGRAHIAAPGRLIARNTALVALAWTTAQTTARRRGAGGG